MIGNSIARVREHLKEPLHLAAWSVMFSSILTSGIGLLFWAVATWIYPIDDVGRDQALIFAMMMLATVFQMNMTNAAVRFLPQVREHLGRRILQAYAIAAGFSFVAGLVFAYVAPALSSQYDFITEDWWLAPAFAIATGFWAIFLVQDPVLMALGKASWLPAKNSVYSVAKLALLPLFFWAASSSHGIFLAWIIPVVVIAPVVDYLMARRAVPAAAERQKDAGGVVDAFGHPRALARFVLQDFAGSSAAHVAIYITPVLTFALLGSEANALYSLPFVIVAGLDLLFEAFVVSLTAEGARSPERIKHLTDLVVRRMLRIQYPASIAVFLAAPLIMLPFPEEFRADGVSVMRIIAIAGFFRAILLFWEAVARLQGHGNRLLWVQLSNTVLLIVLMLVLAPAWGIDGSAAAWLFAAMASALMVLPWLIGFIRNPSVLTGGGDEPRVDMTIDRNS